MLGKRANKSLYRIRATPIESTEARRDINVDEHFYGTFLIDGLPPFRYFRVLVEGHFEPPKCCIRRHEHTVHSRKGTYTCATRNEYTFFNERNFNFNCGNFNFNLYNKIVVKLLLISCDSSDFPKQKPTAVFLSNRSMFLRPASQVQPKSTTVYIN